MGNVVEQWRRAIGRFGGGRRYNRGRVTPTREMSVTGQVLCLALIATLLCIGNIERNPGPGNKDNVERKIEEILGKVSKMESMGTIVGALTY